MILSDSKILQALESGDIAIDPFDREKLNAHSYDVTLGKTLRMYQRQIHTEASIMAGWHSRQYCIIPHPNLYFGECDHLDSKADNPTVEFEIPDDGMVLIPGNLYLMHTVERVNSRRYAPMLNGKSSVGRLGTEIHCTAGYGDVGFSGKHWTLEVQVALPVKVYPGMPIGQIQFEVVDGEILRPYGQNPKSKYNGDNKAEGSKMHKNF